MQQVNQVNSEFNVPQQSPSLFSASHGVRCAKVASVAVAVFTCSYLAYSHPALYSFGLIGLVGGAYYYACKEILITSNPHQLRKVLSIAFVASTIGITGAAVGWTPSMAEAFSVNLVNQDIEQIFLYMSYLTGIFGNLPTFLEFLKLYNIRINSEKFIDNLQRWIEIRNTLKTIYSVESLSLFGRLCFSQTEIPEVASLDKIISFLDEILPRLNKKSKEELIRFYLPHINAQLEKQQDKILVVADSVVKWSEEGEKELVTEFFEKHKKFFDEKINSYKEADPFSKRIQTLEAQLKALDSTPSPSSENLRGLRKEIEALRLDFSNQLKHLATCIAVIGDKHPQYEVLEGYKTLWRGYSKKLNPQKNNVSLSDTLQLLLNKAEVRKEENIDLEDSVWNYLLMQMSARSGSGERKKSIEDLQAWTGKESLDGVDHCFSDWGISTLQDLLDKEMVTKEELISHPDKVWEKVGAYIKTQKKTSDFRFKIYSLLKNSVKHSSSFLLRVDQVAAKVAYRALMAFFILGPVLIRPKQAVVGFVCGIGYGGCVPLHKKINKIIKERFPLLISIGSPFTRRRFFFLNDPSQRHMDFFVRSNLFGRLRLIWVESSLSHLIAFLKLDLGTNHPEAIAVGGLVQSFFLGKDVMKEAIRLLMEGFARLRV